MTPEHADRHSEPTTSFDGAIVVGEFAARTSAPNTPAPPRPADRPRPTPDEIAAEWAAILAADAASLRQFA